MFFQIDKEILSIEAKNIKKDKLTAGFIPISKLKQFAPLFGFSEESVCACENRKKYFRSSATTERDYLFATVKIVKKEETDCIALYIKENLFLVVNIADSDGEAEKHFKQSLKGENIEKVVFLFLDSLISRESHVIEDMDFDLSKLEEAIISGRADKSLPFMLSFYKKRALLLRNFYEQLIDLSEEMLEKEMFDGELIKLFNQKVSRLCGDILQVREELCQARDLYRSSLDAKLNHVMKVLTVLSTLFLPLTLVTSWYGMNFENMPELSWPFGYAGVFALCLGISITTVAIFKRKKWF